jgi:hypothetical protein
MNIVLISGLSLSKKFYQLKPDDAEYSRTDTKDNVAGVQCMKVKEVLKEG